RGDMPELTRYGYRDAMSGFFEFPTENARRILPPNLEPVEVHHGTSVFALTAFDFTKSEVGAYGEVVMAVAVAPLVKPGQPFPKDGEQSYFAQITMEGQHSEHEDEKGGVKLHDHAFNKALSIADVYDVPFREQWMRDGMQTFQPLVQLEAA